MEHSLCGGEERTTNESSAGTSEKCLKVLLSDLHDSGVGRRGVRYRGSVECVYLVVRTDKNQVVVGGRHTMKAKHKR